MHGNEVALLIALAVFGAALLGLLAGLALARMARRPEPVPVLSDPEARAAEADAARVAAEMALAEQQAGFTRQIAARDAELRATMDALGAARRELAALRGT